MNKNTYFRRSKANFIYFVASLCLLMATAHLGSAAPVVDNFNDTSNVTTFGSVNVSATSNILTAQRTAASVDSGYNWLNTGATFFSLNAPDAQFELSVNVNSMINGGFYSISAIIYDASDNFLEEVTLQTDTNSTGVFNYDVSAAATNINAAQYSARVRILPFASTDAGVEFNSLSAVPEPSSALLLFCGVSALMLTRRFSRAYLK